MEFLELGKIPFVFLSTMYIFINVLIFNYIYVHYVFINVNKREERMGFHLHSVILINPLRAFI